VTVIKVVGELDVSTTHILAELADEVARARPARVVLDAADVTFFCAGGLRALLGVQQLVTAAGGQLLLRAPSPCVCRVLTITGTADLFALDPTPTPSTGPEKILGHRSRRRGSSAGQRLDRPARTVTDLRATGWGVVVRRGVDRHLRGIGRLRWSVRQRSSAFTR